MKFIEISRLASFDLVTWVADISCSTPFKRECGNHEQTKTKANEKKKDSQVNWHILDDLIKEQTRQWKSSAKMDLFSNETRQHIFLSR